MCWAGKECNVIGCREGNRLELPQEIISLINLRYDKFQIGLLLKKIGLWEERK